MSIEVAFILSLHSIAAAVTLVAAIRDRLGFRQCLKWGGIGLITGILGLITHARIERHDLDYFRVAQDAIFNLSLEIIGLYGLPYVLKIR